MDRSGSSSSKTGRTTSTESSRNTDGKVKIDLLQAYSLLQAKYGWTIEYIKGKWIKTCPHSQAPCNWGSCFERKTCKEYALELYGLTRPLFLKFVDLCSDDNYQREKRLYNVLGMLIVGKPVIAESNYTNKTIKDVEKKKKDILYDFPYDIPYPTEREIQDNLKYWSETTLESLDRWDEKRANASRGNDMLAKRCSVNSLLWQEYKQKAFGDLMDLKNRVKLDHIRISLYPLNLRHKVCEQPPPIEYWNTLKAEGILKKYIDELKESGFDDLSQVIPMNDELKELVNAVYKVGE